MQIDSRLFTGIGDIENMEEQQQFSGVRRAKFTPTQLQYLEMMYQQNRYPDKNQRQAMATHLALQEIQVNNWFQRRRKKDTDSGNLPNNFSNQIQDQDSAMQTIVPQFSPFPQNGLEDAYQNMQNYNVSMHPYQDQPSSSSQLPDVFVVIDEDAKETSDEEMQDTVEMQPEPSTEQSLAPYLNTSMGLRSEAVKNFIKVMRDEVNVAMRAVMLAAIRKTTDEATLRSFIDSKGGNILRVWLIEATKENSPLLMKILQVLDHLPLDTQSLRSSKLGKALKQSSQNTQQQDAKEMAEQIIAKWRRFLEGTGNVELQEPRRVVELPLDHRKTAEQQESRRTALNEATGVPKSNVTISGDAKRKFLGSSETQNTTTIDSSRRLTGLSTAAKPVTKLRIGSSVASKPNKEIPKVVAAPNTGFFEEILAANQRSIKFPATSDKLKRELPSSSGQKKDVAAKELGESTSTSERSESTKTAFELALESRTQNILNQTQAPNEEDDHLQSNRPKKRKRVSFAPDHQLRQIKIFESEEPENDVDASGAAEIPHQFGNARDLDKNEGLNVFKRSLITPTIDWYPPIEIDLEGFKIPVIESEEAKIQEERKNTILETIYLSRDQIPDSPAEPINMQNLSDNIPCREIPLEDTQPPLEEIQVMASAGPADGIFDPNNNDSESQNQTTVLKMLRTILPQGNIASSTLVSINQNQPQTTAPQPQQNPPLFPQNIGMFGMDIQQTIPIPSGEMVMSRLPQSGPPQQPRQPLQHPPPPMPPIANMDWNYHDPNRGGILGYHQQAPPPQQPPPQQNLQYQPAQQAPQMPPPQQQIHHPYPEYHHQPPPNQTQPPPPFNEGRALPPQSEVRPPWVRDDRGPPSRGRGRGGAKCWFGRDCHKPNCTFIHDN